MIREHCCSLWLALALTTSLFHLALPVDWLFQSRLSAGHWEALSCCAAHSWARLDQTLCSSFLGLLAQDLLEKNNHFLCLCPDKRNCQLRAFQIDQHPGKVPGWLRQIPDVPTLSATPQCLRGQGPVLVCVQDSASC